MSSKIETEDHTQGRKSCSEHGTVEISYTCEHCPLCSILTANSVASHVAMRIGRVFTNLFVQGIPVRFQIHDAPELRETGERVSAEINAALGELASALGMKPSAIARPVPSPIVIPR